MPCFHPVDVPRKGYIDLRVTVACGRCIGCRLDKARDLATRSVHEAKLHDDNCFLTLTYDTEHLPPGGTLVPRHHQLFMKRLRSHLRKPVRYVHVGEYGDSSGRAHYHDLLFGYFPSDAKPIAGTAEKGKPEWTSAELDRLWGLGHVRVGVLNSRTAAYCARYVLKKVGGDMAEAHYRFVDPATGEVFQRHPEYCRVSTKPGIGAGFLDRFFGDIFPSDFCATIEGKQVPVPPYYDKLLQRRDPELFEHIKAQRFRYAMQPRQQANSTPARLAVREEVKRAAIRDLKRPV